jgi:uncharacterized protein YxeA
MAVIAMVVLVVVIVLVIGIVYYYYKNQDTEEEEKEEEEEEEDEEDETALSKYTFYAHKDPSGAEYDLTYRDDLAGNNEKLAEVCTEYGSACVGFNTQGYLKNTSASSDPTQWWTKWTDQPTMGYYKKN